LIAKDGQPVNNLYEALAYTAPGIVAHESALQGGELMKIPSFDRLELRSNTLIVLWGDHGYYLGDQRVWGKKSLFEIALRTPLIFSGPGVPRGVKTDVLVELLDIYPTLCALAGLPAPTHVRIPAQPRC
jgi:arylsulfatase A-like enzyme